MNNYKLYKNFIEKKDVKLLSEWIHNNKHFFQDAGMGGNRITSRFLTDIIYPKVAYKLKDKIEKELQLNNFNYMAASCAFPGDHCYLHKDPKKGNYETLHCNLFLSDVEGGEAFIQKTPTEEDLVKFTKGNMLCYKVSKVYHGSKLLIKGERKMWIYSFSIIND
tara:strand:- start:2187 stop:2678 length:492 start_codon:yes stop_codon:yes gene_type:complete